MTDMRLAPGGPEPPYRRWRGATPGTAGRELPTGGGDCVPDHPNAFMVAAIERETVLAEERRAGVGRRGADYGLGARVHRGGGGRRRLRRAAARRARRVDVVHGLRGVEVPRGSRVRARARGRRHA